MGRVGPLRHKAVALAVGGGLLQRRDSARPEHQGPAHRGHRLPRLLAWFTGNKPANGQGYEFAVAYAVAAQLSFARSAVKWVVEPFDSSYAPGPKKFDFDINEISYTAQRAQAASFSDSYYDVQQSLVALKGLAIVTKHSAAELKSYTLNDVAQALATKQIAAFVTHTPTAQYITSSSEIPQSVMVGQFPSTGEHDGLLFGKGDSPRAASRSVTPSSARRTCGSP